MAKISVQISKIFDFAYCMQYAISQGHTPEQVAECTINKMLCKECILLKEAKESLSKINMVTK